MLYIAKRCSVCETGNIGFRRCSDEKALVLMCDECDALWLSPTTVGPEHALYARPPDFKVPGMGCAIAGGQAGWASRDEVSRQGWIESVAGEGNAMDEAQAAAHQPDE
jgi:hypothetical protein